jgi:hypothetical protein
MKDKKIQKLYNIILNPVTMEDENVNLKNYHS